MTQIWIGVSTCLIIAILHKQLKLPGTFHRTLQLLSVHPFEKVTLNGLLMETGHSVKWEFLRCHTVTILI